MHRPHSCRCRPYRMRHRRSRWNCHRFFCRRRRETGPAGRPGPESAHGSACSFSFLFSSKILYGYFGRRMEGPVPAAWILKTKKGFCPTWDKSLCFCDTTQIDILRCPLAFTHHHAYPTDNGRVPVGPYLGKFPVQAALGRPFTPLRTAPISPPEALLGCPVLCYSSSSQVCRLKLGAFRLSKKLPSQKFRREG